MSNISLILSISLSLISFSTYSSDKSPNFGSADLQNLEDNIKAIEKEEGTLSKNLYSPLIELADRQIKERKYGEASETLQRAQIIGHRHDGVLNGNQTSILSKLSKLRILEEDFKKAQKHQTFLFFLQKKLAKSPENEIKARLDMANWLMDTGQSLHAKSLLAKGLQSLEENPELQLAIYLSDSRARRLEGLCCGWKKLEAALELKPSINKNVLSQVYLEIADSLTLNRKPEKAAEYYKKAISIIGDKGSNKPKPISMKKRLSDTNFATSKYYTFDRGLSYPRKIREMTQEEIDHSPSFEPMWVTINPSQKGFILPDRNVSRDTISKPKKLVGNPMLFQEEQIENVHKMKNRDHRKSIEIEISFDVKSDGNLEKIKVISSNAPQKLNRLMVKSLKNIYFRPALDQSGPIDTSEIKLVQTFNQLDYQDL